MKRISLSALAVAAALCAAMPLRAQQLGASAAIRGRVLDPQKRGVPARVQVRYARTGVTRDTTADWNSGPLNACCL